MKTWDILSIFLLPSLSFDSSQFFCSFLSPMYFSVLSAFNSLQRSLQSSGTPLGVL